MSKKSKSSWKNTCLVHDTNFEYTPFGLSKDSALECAQICQMPLPPLLIHTDNHSRVENFNVGSFVNRGISGDTAILLF